MVKKLEQKAQQAVTNYRLQRMSGRLGVIIKYDETTNTATVAISGEQTDQVEEILTKVMCPVQLGVQGVAPQPGTNCWVVFKDDNITQPLISHYYNHRYEQFDYAKQVRSKNDIPNYLLGI